MTERWKYRTTLSVAVVFAVVALAANDPEVVFPAAFVAWLFGCAWAQVCYRAQAREEGKK